MPEGAAQAAGGTAAARGGNQRQGQNGSTGSKVFSIVQVQYLRHYSKRSSLFSLKQILFAWLLTQLSGWSDIGSRSTMKPLMWIILVTKFFGGGQKAPATAPEPVVNRDIPAATPGQQNLFNAPPANVHMDPSWLSASPLAMHVHLSTSPLGDVFSKKWTSGYRKDPDAGLPSFVWENITFGDWSDSRVIDYEVSLPEASAILPGRILVV
jgi:hypothetical protein